MKHTNPFSGYLKHFVLIALISILSSCREEVEEPVSESEEVEIANQSSSTDAITDEEIQAIDEELAATPEGGRNSGTACAIVTRNEVAKTITLDFGAGCVGPYGRERSGKIIITYGGTFGDHLANRVISFDNYFVNNKQITGKIELRDFNLDEDGNPTATRKRVDLAIHFPDGNKFTSNGSVTVTWLEGFNDGDPTNDRFSISGGYEGVSTRGRQVTHTILEPVLVDVSCTQSGGFARVAGEVELKITGARERVRVVSYGDGTCDKTITVTINAQVYVLSLL